MTLARECGARRKSQATTRLRAVGFTLTEVITVSAVMIVVVGAILAMFASGQTSYLSADVSIQVQEQARKALDIMIRELREAGGTVTPSAGGKQLDFQVALGYNLYNAADPILKDCPQNAVCWGARDQFGGLRPNWNVRYLVQVNPAIPNTQLVRQIISPTLNPPEQSTQVVAMLVNGPAVAGNPNDTAFGWDATNRVVTVILEVQNQNRFLPGGVQSSSPLNARVKLRNS